MSEISISGGDVMYVEGLLYGREIPGLTSRMQTSLESPCKWIEMNGERFFCQNVVIETGIAADPYKQLWVERKVMTGFDVASEYSYDWLSINEMSKLMLNVADSDAGLNHRVFVAESK